ncbi:MAG TPA: branched-chain amino acid ABC transporter permease [Roseiarcus sp.]|jgi:branched-chain amino acid transport system permease protein
MSPQILMDGLINGAMIGLGAIGITLTYSILRFSNFAHGEFIAWGAYIALALSGFLGVLAPSLTAPLGPFSFGWSLPIAAFGAIALTAALALLADALLFGPLRARGGASIILVMASFGAALVLRNLLEFIFTSRPAYYADGLQIALRFLGVRATPDALLCLLVAAIVVVATHLFITHTAVGRAMRAVSENPELAGIVGVDSRKTIRLVWILGAGLACLAGIMAGLVVQIRPTMGVDLLLPLFAAAILGGIGSTPGALLGGLIIGLAESTTVRLIGAEWRAAVAFAVLVVILLVRPRGLFGRS